MPDSTESKPELNGSGPGTAADTSANAVADAVADSAASAGRRSARLLSIPRPRTMGSFVTLVTALAFAAGWVRNELALTLLGTVFLTILGYCFLGVFLLGLVHRRRAMSLSMIITTETVSVASGGSVGKEGELSIKTSGGLLPAKNYFWRLPAIFIRCELFLETKDHRVICHYADPGVENYSSFPVRERGVYFSDLRSDERDRLIIFDATGFFHLPLPVPQISGPRLFAVPAPAEELMPLSLKSGGTKQRTEPHYRKSDELTDHRPYIPGDDPRRINWKLYSHAPLGDLFVREGEPEPPPHSRLLILLDTEADSGLYSLDEGRRAVDLLCESALAAALEFSDQGLEILVGCSGHGIMGGGEESAALNAAELAAALAWPAAVLTADLHRADLRGEIPEDLPQAPKDGAVLVFALPRTSFEPSALDRFLKKREVSQGTDIVFLYSVEDKRAAELEDAAKVCVNLYNGRQGVHASRAAVSAAVVRGTERIGVPGE